ncbi:hypothetical protein D3C85_1619460 [compost metagenome]
MPFAGYLPALLLLLFLKPDELIRRRMMVNNADPRLLEGMQHGAVQLQQRPVLPQRSVG